MKIMEVSLIFPEKPWRITKENNENVKIAKRDYEH